MRRADWKSAATAAGNAVTSARLQSVTAIWAAARQEYLTLWDAQPTNVAALTRAIRRFEDLDRQRRSLARQLDAAA